METTCALWTTRVSTAHAATAVETLWKERWSQHWGRPTTPTALSAPSATITHTHTHTTTNHTPTHTHTTTHTRATTPHTHTHPHTPLSLLLSNTSAGSESGASISPEETQAPSRSFSPTLRASAGPLAIIPLAQTSY